MQSIVIRTFQAGLADGVKCTVQIHQQTRVDATLKADVLAYHTAFPTWRLHAAYIEAVCAHCLGDTSQKTMRGINSSSAEALTSRDVNPPRSQSLGQAIDGACRRASDGAGAGPVSVRGCVSARGLIPPGSTRGVVPPLTAAPGT